jgi:hypothetical protein
VSIEVGGEIQKISAYSADFHRNELENITKIFNVTDVLHNIVFPV